MILLKTTQAAIPYRIHAGHNDVLSPVYKPHLDGVMNKRDFVVDWECFIDRLFQLRDVRLDEGDVCEEEILENTKIKTTKTH